MPMTTQRFLQIVAIIIVVLVGVLAVQHYQECQQPPGRCDDLKTKASKGTR
jgi:hypothetical protein